MTWGTGTAGPLTARFCALRVRPPTGRGDRWLLCERSATDERKYYLLHLPATTPLVDLVALARSRWPIEQQYRELKDDLGLDHFEGRTYQGWTHHVVLTAVAFTFLQIERGRPPSSPDPRCPSSADGCAKSWACSTSSTTGGYSRCSTASAGMRRSEGDKVVLTVQTEGAAAMTCSAVDQNNPGVGAIDDPLGDYARQFRRHLERQHYCQARITHMSGASTRWAGS